MNLWCISMNLLKNMEKIAKPDCLSQFNLWLWHVKVKTCGHILSSIEVHWLISLSRKMSNNLGVNVVWSWWSMEWNCLWWFSFLPWAFFYLFLPLCNACWMLIDLDKAVIEYRSFDNTFSYLLQAILCFFFFPDSVDMYDQVHLNVVIRHQMSCLETCFLDNFSYLGLSISFKDDTATWKQIIASRFWLQVLVDTDLQFCIPKQVIERSPI